MSKTVVVSVLVDNFVPGRELMAEHGLAFHVQRGSDRLLFDTGQSGLVAANARRMGVDLSTLGAVALSHGHYDHTGGLPVVWPMALGAALQAHPGVMASRFVRNADGTVREVGMSEAARALVSQQSARFHPSSAPVEVMPGIHLTGEIPRETDFEDVGGPFFLDDSGAQPDPILDDQALYFDTRDGVVVLLGCAHAGVVNTLRHISRLAKSRPLHAVLGGMHLLNASADRLNRTIEALGGFAPQVIGPAHCTGVAPLARLWSRFPKACAVCGVGSRFVFPC